MAQYPFFNPNHYAEYFNDPVKIEHTRLKAVTDANEPGLMMKAITVAIALKANKVLKAKGEKPFFDPNEKMPTADGSFPGRRKPIKDTSFHKYLNMNMGVKRSSNIYMARLVQRIIVV